METFQFPWNPKPNSTDPLINTNSTTEIPSSTPRWKQLAWKWAPATGVLIFLGLFAFQRAGDAGNSLPMGSPPTVDVLVAMVPIPKGQIVSAELFRQIPVDKKDLTKTQLLRLVRPNDTEHWNGKVRAKKDLAPQQPVFWSDLQFDFNPGNNAIQSPRIHVSKEN